MEGSMLKNKQVLMIYLFLMIATLAVFWQVTNCDFIDFDDQIYVTDNKYTLKGITLEGIRWAITTGHEANWHPLTYFSHMLDVQLYGLQPRWHHLTNLLFHVANTLLLFFVLQRMTKARWESAFVAALFALHPLHVESVAWVAERKDVLSTFFWILTMGAYCYYVERQRVQRYLLVVLVFALGLMAKPMLVTLPFVLLLLDYWPLQRFRQVPSDQKSRTAIKEPVSGNKQKGKSRKRHTAGEEVKAETPAASPYQWALIRPLLWEKIPLFALTVLSSIVTYRVQQQGGAIASIRGLSLGTRISNALISYITYIGKMIWPSDLAVLYPLPHSLPALQVFWAALLMTVVTITVIWKARRAPYLATGWLWYAGTLVPVIGLVQVGYQVRADRYTYVPLIGLFIIVAWGISELSKKWRYRKEVLVASSAVVLVCFSMVTLTQVRYWRNTITLFDHTLNVTDDNSVAYNFRGTTHLAHGNDSQAVSDYDRAIEINPKYVDAYINRSVANARLGNHEREYEDYKSAARLGSKIAQDVLNRQGIGW
jgi:hypothetical protein